MLGPFGLCSTGSDHVLSDKAASHKTSFRMTGAAACRD